MCYDREVTIAPTVEPLVWDAEKFFHDTVEEMERLDVNTLSYPITVRIMNPEVFSPGGTCLVINGIPHFNCIGWKTFEEPDD